MKKDFLAITDLTKDEIWEIFDLAKELKSKTKEGIFDVDLLENKVIGLIFTKPSLRTRISFEVGIRQLGGDALYITNDQIKLGVRESIYDAAKVLSRFLDGIMIRTFDHSDVEQLAEHAEFPVINGLTDLLHPCQVMADLFTVLEHRGNLDDLKVVFVGDGNNVCNSWLNAASRLPMHFVLACPRGYEPNAEIVKNAVDAGVSQIEILHDAKLAVKNADVIYADTFVSMGQEEEKQKRLREFQAFQVNEELLSYAKDTVLFEHCLPAYRGIEVTDAVMDGKHSVVFDEAENRMHAQKAIIYKLFNK
jgi:ornithine carbamoyltransferase